MRRIPYLLLRQLALMQLATVIVGLGLLSTAFFLVTRSTFDQALRNERAKVRLSVSEQQEKWRTWKQVGLEEALAKDLASHTRVFSLSRLEVVPASSLPQDIPKEWVILPAPEAKADWVVLAILDPSHIEAAYVPYRSNLVILILSGLLFCCVIWFSSRYIRKQFYLPFQELKWVFEAYNAGKEIEDSGIRAKGEIRDFIHSLIDLYKKLKETEKNSAMVAVARQVAHDIRSPLAALDMILDTLPQLPEQKRLIIRGALNRIRDIANNVLERSRRSHSGESLELVLPQQPTLSESTQTHLVASLVEEIVTEKQVICRQTPGVQLDSEVEEGGYGLFSRVQAGVFKAVLSNLVNNAMEAVGETGSIRVTLRSRRDSIELSVWDDGPGIPDGVLQRLKAGEGASFGKLDGSGIGLKHARTVLENWGGRLEIDSKPSVGTRVTLFLPTVPPPRWFVPRIDLEEGATVIVLDDDASIHLVWQQRFSDAMKQSGVAVTLEHFSDTRSVRRWFAQNPVPDNLLFLCDYEILGESESGVDLLQNLGLVSRAILVTGRFDEPALRAQCESLGLRLLPKGLGGCLPVNIAPKAARFDALLVDDDPLVHMTWELAAKTGEKQFRAFYRSVDILENLASLDRSTPVYIDRHLGNQENGEDLCSRLAREGFSEVYLATGDAETELPAPESMPWLAGIRGKAPPWGRDTPL